MTAVCLEAASVPVTADVLGYILGAVRSVFESCARNRGSEPFCVRIPKLFAGSGFNLREIMRDEVTPILPWRIALPLVDTSFTEMRKGQVVPDKARELEHGSSYSSHTVAYTDGSKTEN